jgi:putative tryptophan/tyrosine transport system substrate-binding protein
MRRRHFVTAMVAVLVAASARSFAQQPSGKVPRIGILTPADSDRTPIFDAFRAGLRDLGYVEGRDIVLEFRVTRGDFSLFPRLAAELVSLPVDLIVTDGGPAVTRTAMQATKEIPIVNVTGGKPHMRVSWVKRALHCQPKTAPVASLFSGPALSSFPNSYQQLTDGGPVELWATH